MQTVYIALGSNLENPLEQLKQAVEKLKKFANEFEISPFYGSKPVGPQDQPDYVNAVAKFSTDLSPTALLDKLQSIENEQGRVRVRRWGENFRFGYYFVRQSANSNRAFERAAYRDEKSGICDCADV